MKSKLEIYGEKGNWITHLRYQETIPTAEDWERIQAMGINIPGEIHHAYISVLKPGGFIVPHIDAGSRFHQRWQVPIQIAGILWAEGESLRITSPYEIKHWLPHAVYNNDDVDRIHLIVETTKIVYTPEEPILYQSTEMIPEIQELINKLK